MSAVGRVELSPPKEICELLRSSFLSNEVKKSIVDWLELWIRKGASSNEEAEDILSKLRGGEQAKESAARTRINEQYGSNGHARLTQVAQDAASEGPSDEDMRIKSLKSELERKYPKVDKLGFFVWKDGEITFVFGKRYPGKTLRWVIENDISYVKEFMLVKMNSPKDVRELLLNALKGIYPATPQEREAA